MNTAIIVLTIVLEVFVIVYSALVASGLTFIGENRSTRSRVVSAAVAGLLTGALVLNVIKLVS